MKEMLEKKNIYAKKAYIWHLDKLGIEVLIKS